MSRNRFVILAAAALLLSLAGSAIAQEVVMASGNSVVLKDANGATRKYTMGAGATVMVDGKSVPLSELKPGMKVSETVSGTSEAVMVTSVREAKVLEVSGTNLVVRNQDNAIKRFVIDGDFKFLVNGQYVGVTEIKPGMNLTAVFVTKVTGADTSAADAAAAKATADAAAAKKAAADKAAAEKAAADAAAAKRAAADKAAADAAAARAAEEAAAAKAAEDAAAAKLPKTGSPLPLIGLLGFASLAAGFGLRMTRRSRSV